MALREQRNRGEQRPVGHVVDHRQDHHRTHDRNRDQRRKAGDPPVLLPTPTGLHHRPTNRHSRRTHLHPQNQDRRHKTHRSRNNQRPRSGKPGQRTTQHRPNQVGKLIADGQHPVGNMQVLLRYQPRRNNPSTNLGQRISNPHDHAETQHQRHVQGPGLRHQRNRKNRRPTKNKADRGQPNRRPPIEPGTQQRPGNDLRRTPKQNGKPGHGRRVRLHEHDPHERDGRELIRGLRQQAAGGERTKPRKPPHNRPPPPVSDESRCQAS